MTQLLIKTVMAMAIAFLAIQFIPVNLSNPPIETEITTSPEIKAILKRACYDCHSHETVWPWYSQVAPISWLLAWDVTEGREELNFSTWNRYDSKKIGKIMKEMVEEIEEGDMPPWFYLPLHPEARLTASDRKLLIPWAQSHYSSSIDHDD